jgi:hypothetical protein
MPEKHVILTLNYEGETRQSQAAIVTEAKAIKSKLERKGHTATLHTEQLAFQKWMTESTESKGLNKIHIVAHGNQAQCGDYNAAGLADYIRAYIKGKRDLKAITIHSCMSAAEHPGTKEIFVKQFASRLLTHLKDDFAQYIVVRGSDGESYTDSTGRNWVLKDGVEIPNYRTREAELSFLDKNTKARGSARPKYAISNTGGYRGVDAV